MGGINKKKINVKKRKEKAKKEKFPQPAKKLAA
jgi:hypothetical protein